MYTSGPAKADGALSYEKARLTTEIDANVYTGAPRPVHDEAWARIIERKSWQGSQCSDMIEV
jgi:hypothetical protein